MREGTRPRSICMIIGVDTEGLSDSMMDDRTEGKSNDSHELNFLAQIKSLDNSTKARSSLGPLARRHRAVS
jgi:hypothetical protein